MIRVFIYDDNDARKESLMTLLDFTDNMLFVGAASDCSDVKSDMIKSIPDIVLMDIEMPHADGIEGVRQIKINFPNIKVIMQTVYEDINKIFKAFQYGAAGYILKKSSIDHIIESIEMVYEDKVFITPSMALQVINHFSALTSADNAMSPLSKIESEIIHLISDGYSTKIIAEKLYLNDDLVNKHIKNISTKLQIIK